MNNIPNNSILSINHLFMVVILYYWEEVVM